MNKLRCCTPTFYDARSKQLIHSQSCTAGKAEQPLSAKEFAEFRHPSSSVVHPEPPLRLVRLDPEQPHPACVTAHADGGIPCSRCCDLLHPGGCECGHCGYADAHRDDEVTA